MIDGFLSAGLGFCEDPGSVGVCHGGGGEGDDFRDFVGMKLGEGCLEGGKGGAGGFKNGEDFGGGFDFPFPAVNRLDGGHEIDASGELPFHQDRANLSRLLVEREHAKDQ